ncbi:GIY-YIG nuclease family protein [Variovorax paradoxus]|uniref:GIY-YIG nuclease family protein n=1 Tax=Variovorax paradoxus TaxID=34073 RepID=UPI0029C9760D|nr:GIY-YIG nuclease family protein [Variovorax paradoxus]WPH22298.1 GIY-YIG nuclease family protein [Variovorax paradoxus]
MTKVRCVYQIRNLVNGRCYIGSTENFTQRKWRHFYDLGRGEHRSRFMQRDFSKCGRAAFVIEVVEQVDATQDLLAREQHWLDTSRPHYNSAKVAGSVVGVRRSPESVRRNRERNAGFGNGNSRITAAQAEEVRMLIAEMTTKQIAVRFGVATTTIQRLCRRLGIEKPARVYGAAARALFSANAGKNIAGRNALTVHVFQRGASQAVSAASLKEAAQLLGIGGPAIAKRLKRHRLSFCGDFCISREPINVATVAWPHRRTTR